MSSHTITLIIGDWSDDGHGKTRHVKVTANVSAVELVTNFTHGLLALGLKNTDKPFQYLPCCEDYGDNVLDPKIVNGLRERGLWLEELEEGFYDDEYHLYHESYAKVWMQVAKAGNPELEWELSGSFEEIRIGGYGLFD